mgnify:CR=1 FL=1
MLLYTPMPLELVMEGLDKERNYIELDYDGIKLLVEPLDMTSGKIVRIMSTNPQDYLNSSLSPGAVIRYKI